MPWPRKSILTLGYLGVLTLVNPAWLDGSMWIHLPGHGISWPKWVLLNLGAPRNGCSDFSKYVQWQKDLRSLLSGSKCDCYCNCGSNHILEECSNWISKFSVFYNGYKKCKTQGTRSEYSGFVYTYRHQQNCQRNWRVRWWIFNPRASQLERNAASIRNYWCWYLDQTLIESMQTCDMQKPMQRVSHHFCWIFTILTLMWMFLHKITNMSSIHCFSSSFCSTCSSSQRSSIGMRSLACSQRSGSEAPSGSPAARGTSMSTAYSFHVAVQAYYVIFVGKKHITDY